MKKIYIIGCPGSGKTCFANFLAKLLDIDVLHLDDIYWDSNWEKRNFEQVTADLKGIVHKNMWIIEGCYEELEDIIIEKADVVLLLRIGAITALFRVIRRCIMGVLRKQKTCGRNRESLKRLFGKNGMIDYTLFQQRRYETYKESDKIKVIKNGVFK